MMLTQRKAMAIDWDKVLEIDSHIYSSFDPEARKKHFWKTLEEVFKSRPNLDKDISPCDFLFVKSMRRADYDWLFESIAQECLRSKRLLDIYRIYTGKLRPYPLLLVLKYFPLFFSMLSHGFHKAVYLFVKAVGYLEVLERVGKFYPHQNLVVFADMQPIDNLLVQAARLRNQKTVTLQHGLYVDYSEKPNINVVNYKNMVSEYFLAWGAATGELINNYHSGAKVVLCGKPMKEPALQDEQGDYFTVLFDQNAFRSYNAEMLRIAYDLAKKTKLKVNVRFHPRNNPASYRVRQDSTYTGLSWEGSRFILAHTTSMIHEIMRFGVPVFKYDTEIPCADVPCELKFKSVDDLRGLVAGIRNAEFDFEEVAGRYICSVGDESLFRYRDFFSRV
ncbi:hypothetical protein IB274_25100 [Pseudomonas sp. PDM18]|nr:hypothetical protein [Pseudomonas sp. PDM18]